jgi:hypothetical protein
MGDWILANPHPAVAILAVGCGGVGVFIRFVLSRHREYVAFTAHMRREEDEVWPAITKQLSDYHEETLGALSAHSERIARLEARMPNGQITEMMSMLRELVSRRA